MSEVSGVPNDEAIGRGRRNMAALGAAHWLGLAAAQTFAIMALLIRSDSLVPNLLPAIPRSVVGGWWLFFTASSVLGERQSRPVDWSQGVTDEVVLHCFAEET